jgi:5-hydroxyisourate hydrolase
VARSRPTISTHVLDLGSGEPAAGVPVALFRLDEDGQPALLSEAETDADGRVLALLRDDLQPGSYQLVFDVAAYLHDEAEFFENMAVGFRIDDPERSYHVPLLLSPFGLSTYRGS